MPCKPHTIDIFTHCCTQCGNAENFIKDGRKTWIAPQIEGGWKCDMTDYDKPGEENSVIAGVDIESC